MSASSNKILFYLKQHGASALAPIAAALDMTTMGARGHLHKLEQQQLIEFNDITNGPGRPTRHWSLTPNGHSQFGDRHQDLTIQLLDSVQSIFGQQGLKQLLDLRAEKQHQAYLQELTETLSLEPRLQLLAQIRQREGYMARIEPSATGFRLIEDHCPICEAAKSCRGICANELALFQDLLAGLATVERSEHLLDEARRCCYLITPLTSAAAS